MALPRLRIDLDRIRANKNWLMLAAALILGLTAMWAAHFYIKTRIETAEASLRAGMAPIKVVVANRNLKPGMRVSAEAFAVREFPKTYVHQDAILPNQFPKAEGQRLIAPVDSGKPLLWAHLESGATPTFSAKLGQGRRALTVPVDEVNSISGMLVPGDRIDLILTLSREGKNASEVTFPLLQDVKVLATGTQVSSRDDPDNKTHAAGLRRYTTVTLETSFEDANRIILARNIGKLTAVLRHPDDKQTHPNSRFDVSSLYFRTPQRGGVEFIIGGI